MEQNENKIPSAIDWADSVLCVVLTIVGMCWPPIVAILAGMKIFGMIHWSWFWILSPVGLFVLLGAILILIKAIGGGGKA